MRVDAIVLHYDTPQETAACVVSLTESMRQPAKVWLLDNGSPTVPARELGLSGVELVELPRNLGFAGGCNEGLRRAFADGADAVLLLNSDARLMPDALGWLEAALLDPGVAAVAPVVRRPDGMVESAGIDFSRRTARMRLRDAGRPEPRSFDKVAAVAGTAVLLRRAALVEVGLFDAAYFYAFEDLDLGLRLGAAGWRSVVERRATCVHLGSRSIGAESPERLYFALRNHLRLVDKLFPSLWRPPLVVSYYLMQVLLRPPAPRLPSLSALGRGLFHHLRRRYGPP